MAYPISLRFFVFAEVTFVFGVLMCLFLSPAGWNANSGLSYFGVTRATFLPYGISLLAIGIFLYKSAEALPSGKDFKKIKIFFFALLPLAIGLMLTPYTLGTVVDWLHRFFGSAAFILQLTLCVWLALKIYNDRWNVLALLAQIIGGVMAFVSLDDQYGYLLQGQILFQIAFGFIVFRTLKKMLDNIKIYEQ